MFTQLAVICIAFGSLWPAIDAHSRLGVHRHLHHDHHDHHYLHPRRLHHHHHHHHHHLHHKPYNSFSIKDLYPKPIDLKPRVHPAESYYSSEKEEHPPELLNSEPTEEKITSRAVQDRQRYDAEVLSHITGQDEGETIPHQYAVQVRWKKPQKPNPKYRVQNNERTRYRNYAHQEEEHWHDKDWIDIGLPPEVAREVDKKQIDDQLYAHDSRFATLPAYARPIKNGGSGKRIRKHFAVPSKSFPVNKKFRKWSTAPIEMSDPMRRQDDELVLDTLPYVPFTPKESGYYHFK